MNLDKDSTELTSWLGSFFTFLIFAVISAYIYYKVGVLLNKQDIDILETSNFLALTDDDQINFDKGLNIAVALITDDSDKEELFNDPTIGEIVFNHYKWGKTPDGKHISGRYRIESHPCTREELGLDGDGTNAKFLPINANFRNAVDAQHKKLLCLNREDLMMYGNFQTEKAQLLNVQFVKCHDRTDCKSDKEIKSFLRDSYLFMLSNQVRFDNSEFGKKAIIAESVTTWMIMNTQIQQTIPWKLQTTELELQDLIVDFDEIT